MTGSSAATPLRVVLASNNAKKLRELQQLMRGAAFEGRPLELVAQPAIGVAEADEPHATFLENALAKARHAAAATGLPALADDSGLCVDALGGAPGVISAHYAGLVAASADREETRARQDAANNAALVRALAGVEDRRGAFVCTLVFVRSADDPEPRVATGRWAGRVLPAARGAEGFGYDPLLWIDALGRSVAELEPAQKAAHSHRARAAAAMRRLLEGDAP